ncbi:cytochrome c [Chitinophaga horti]|uniref:Cytochrome c n=1 Tax=Chitinophaga horti TaxID=2920382 RepID=A0ABY6J6Y7_9BACT|nr:cytochrome c [Chitinophaga horti]UYQ95449.1 cytochrome c [Chitinophaga horti]
MPKRLLILLFLFSFSASQAQTFSDVAPILVRKCGSCHRPGDAGPFPLLKYEDYAKRLSFIEEVITSGYMPPWRADTAYRHFANERGLTTEERTKILAWIKAKGPKGKPVDVEATAAATNRKPDLVLQTKTKFLVKGDNLERFVEFKVPFELPADKTVEAVELVTNNRKIIHHINYGFYRVADKAIDINAGVSTINTMDREANVLAFQPFKKEMVYYTGWIPGSSTEYYPGDFGWALPARGVVIFTAHYAAIAADEESVVGVNVYFKDGPVKRPVRIISVGSGGVGERDITPALVIRPNTVSSYELKMRTPEEQSLLYVWPHMHLLGKSFEAFVVTPAKDTIRLVHIPEWDFRWQELYRFKKPVKIPQGSIIHMKGTYDNTAANPVNPNKPPKYVFSSGNMKSDDEMFTLLLIYAQYQPGDEQMVLE